MSDSKVEAEEGNFATLRCVVVGSPIPTVVWQKNTTLVNNNKYNTYLPTIHFNRNKSKFKIKI